MLAHLLTVVGYILATVLVQGLSHFRVNKAHYEEIGIYREKPLAQWGVLSMLVQAVILSLAYDRMYPENGLIGAIVTAAAFGLFLGSYMVLALAGELKMPSTRKWMQVEATSSTIQFALIAVLMWLAHSFAA